MRITFVTRGFPSKNDLMNGNYESVQAIALAAKGCQVSVISVTFKSILFLFCRSRITHRKEKGVDVFECVRIRFSTQFWSLSRLDDYLRVKAYMDLFHKSVEKCGMPDIIHPHSIFCAWPVSFVKDKYDIPIVITEHWTVMNRPDVSEWQKEKSFIYHKADKIICVSQALANSLERNYKVKSIIINNMVSDLFFQSRKINHQDGKIRFIACGAFRYDRNKGFDILVDAFALANFSDNVSLDIIGDGPDRPFVEKKIQDYNLGNKIHLLGVKKPEEVSDLLCVHDCFVLSSRLETFAIVVAEAMAKGLPVIATRSGGPETFLRPEHGLLVEKENAQELTDAMKYMVMHYKDYDESIIRNYCHDHFSQDVIADSIINVYNQLLNKN